MFSFWARQPLNIPSILASLKAESFAVQNISQDSHGLNVFLDDHEAKNPVPFVEALIQKQVRILSSKQINLVTSVSRVTNLPAIYKSIQDSISGTDVNARWILVFDAPGDVPDNILRMIREASRIKIERVIYPGPPMRFGICQKSRGIDLIEDGFYHCLDDDNIVHPEFFKGIERAMAKHPEKKAFVFNQQRWDGHGDLLARPDRMIEFLVDDTMFVVHKDLIGSDRYDVEKSGTEDFHFFRKLYDKDPDAFVFIDEYLAYYNYLVHHTTPERFAVKLSTALVTVPRQEDYLNQTIRSLEESKFFEFPRDVPLRLVAGCPDTSHLDSYKEQPTKFVIDPLGPHEASEIGFDLLDKKPRCAFGHYRAMRSLLSVESKWDVALICEDDVRFARGWRAYLDRLIPEIRQKYGDRWMLTLYRIDHPHQKGTAEELKKGSRYFEPDKSLLFCGTQAVVYPQETLKLMPQCLLEGCIRKFVEPVDITLGEFAKKQGIAILVSVPSLVQHIGNITTGQSDWFHQAECFLESVEDISR